MNRTAALTATLLLLPLGLHAQDAPTPNAEAKPTQPKPKQLPEPGPPEPQPQRDGDVFAAPPVDVVTVTGARAERIQVDVERSISIVTQDDVRLRRPPRNLTDLLQQVPGVHGQETGPAQGSPFIRGLTGFHVLTLIDGVRLNTSFFRTGPNQYNGLLDPLIIDRLEVLRGPGSTLYGSDALGGVIALHTRVPTPPKGTEPGAAWGRAGGYFRATLPTRKGAEWQLQPRVELQGGVGPVAAIVGFDYQHVGDREGGQHLRTLRNTGYSVRNGDIKVVAKLSPKDTLTFAYQATDIRNGPRTHSTIFGERYRNSSVGSDLRRDLDNSRHLLYVQAETKDRGVIDRGKLSVSLQQFGEEQKRLRGSGSFGRTGFSVWSLGTFLELETDLPLPVDTTIVYGVDWYHDFVDTYATTDGVRSFGSRGGFADDANYDLFGAFMRVEVDLDVVLLTAGMRYTLAHIHASKVDPDPTDAFTFGKLSKTYQDVTGSFGAIVPLIEERLSLVGNINQGFRAPNLDDTTAFQAVSSNSFDTPSPSVDPERSLSLEVGVKWSWPFLRGQLFYAYTFLDDLIQRIPTGNQIAGQDEFVKDNFADGSIQSIDGEVLLVWDPIAKALELDAPKLGLSVRGRFSWTRGYAENLINGRKANDHLRRTPPARGAVAFRWDHPDQGWIWAEVEGEFIRKQRRLSVGDLGDTQRIPPRGTPSYTLWHVRAGVRLLEDRLKFSVGLENVFDRDYRVHGSGTNGPGRRLVFALDLLY